MQRALPNIHPELLHSFPPAPVVREFSRLLGSEVTGAHVLDLGCGTGRNTRFLADLGHTVLGITNDVEEAQAARYLSSTPGCYYVVGDIRELPLRATFNIVLANEVLHQISKDDSRAVLEAARAITAANGLHVVSGYLADGQVLDIRNQQRCFKPFELKKSYEQAGWEVLSYNETRKRPTYVDNKELVNSSAAIVARKR